jgi:D-glycero-D-manno-heptose 1,7-bisphosphate phosphatase
MINFGQPMALLDRDGVLNQDSGYPHRPEHIVWVDGALDALARLRIRGYRTVVVTNQSGVARGYFSEADVEALHHWMAGEIARAGGNIDAFYYCPFHVDASVARYRQDHPDRKPNPGMLNKALEQFRPDRAQSFLIGDQPSDLAAAKAAGIAGYRFEGGNLDTLVAEILVNARRPDV